MKKIIVLLLAFAMLLSLAACGVQTVEEDTTDEPQSEQEVVADIGEEKKADTAPDAVVVEESNAAEFEQDEPAIEDTAEDMGEEQPLAPDVTEDKQPVEDEKSETPVSDDSDKPAVPQQPVHQHSYTTSVTHATCTTKGYTTYTCECGHSYTADYNGGNGHKYEEVYENLPVYEKVPIMRCGGCHANLDDVGGVAHIKEEALAGTGGSSYSDVDYVIVGYEDQLVGYACFVCGAER